MTFTTRKSETPLLLDVCAIFSALFGLLCIAVLVVTYDARALFLFVGLLITAVLFRAASVALRLLQDMRDIAVLGGSKQEPPPPAAANFG